MSEPRLYALQPAKGQAILNFNGRRFPEKIEYFETKKIEEVRNNFKEERQTDNMLIHGDCLSACAFLKKNNIKVDLVYIDPPFASGANYAKKIYLRNREKSEVEKEFEKDNVSSNCLEEEIMYGDIWNKEDYLNWLYERLLAIRDVMSEEGSIYVHLDWHIGHYVKVLLDEVFGEINFRNEIIWGYRIQGVGTNTWARKHDNLYYYTKSNDYIFNPEKEKIIYEKPFIDTLIDKNGNYYSEVFVRDVWDCDYTKPFISGSKEYLQYRTQKPEGLLQRIINASSNEKMIVADFFCGSGVAAKVSYELGRRFIACDIGINAVQTTRDRLKKTGAEFDIYKINDGIKLFRNPVQTKNKIMGLIKGYRDKKEIDISGFWDGIIDENGICNLVKFIDVNTRLTHEQLIFIVEQAYKEYEKSRQEYFKVVYAHKDIEVNSDLIKSKLRRDGIEGINIDLISVDELLKGKSELFFSDDNAEFEVNIKNGKYIIKITMYKSSYLNNKITQFNSRKKLKGSGNRLRISDRGLELIESIQFDTVMSQDGIWKTTLEDKADIKNAVKGEYEIDVPNFRIKIRNIAGDEVVFESIISDGTIQLKRLEEAL